MSLKLALFFSIVACINACPEEPIATEIATHSEEGSCNLRSSHDESIAQNTLRSIVQERQPCSADITPPHRGLSQVPEHVGEKGWLYQIHDVQRSWRNLRNDRYSIVSSILVRLFKENDRAQTFFSKFANVPVESLKDDHEYNKQVALVADRLDNIITAMDDKVQLLDNIDYMKRSHIERGIPRGPWKDFSRILFDVLGSAGMSSKELNSWKSVLTVFINGIAPV
ncbi:hypothetical protein OUZ56_015138 [Daphnia magna]|uniref:Globin domain-containing protein n=1 Tax=Daphnia magna TaxID=35525 RepID=A0ABR0ALX0_9CRUS|nr:hypothetical protein OUZ56_015138 [Daphnia magna]